MVGMLVQVAVSAFGSRWREGGGRSLLGIVPALDSLLASSLGLCAGATGSYRRCLGAGTRGLFAQSISGRDSRPGGDGTDQGAAASRPRTWQLS